MNLPNPAIVAQSAVRRMPRIALLLLCAAYVLPGFLGRGAWKSADVGALGVMAELALGHSSWLAPSLAGQAAEAHGLLPYWLGALGMLAAPAGVSPDLAARLPFVALLALTLVATWYGAYYLARTPRAQPVAFAFGGEALPTDYARAIADGALLAFIACLGLAQLSHETTPALAQLCFGALLFYGASARPYRFVGPALAMLAGMLGLAFSGAPIIAMMLGLGSACIHALDSLREESHAESGSTLRVQALIMGLVAVCAGLLPWGLDLWDLAPQWQVASWSDLNGHVQLFMWFTWPAWPLAMWTVWRWRRQFFSLSLSRHLALPAWYCLVIFVSTLMSGAPDRTLLLALPALASLAAFALPTLGRSVSALVDWFTLLFFSWCGVTIWVVWIAMQTGIPPQPAANVARLAPGFVPAFSAVHFILGALATLAWSWLVKWRVGRHRAAIWKSLVLPASGAALCWLLLMTLWLPLLNYTQGYASWVAQARDILGTPRCVATWNVSQSRMAALQFYGHFTLRPLDEGQSKTRCEWLLIDAGDAPPELHDIDAGQWSLQPRAIRHPADGNQTLHVYRRNTPANQD